MAEKYFSKFKFAEKFERLPEEMEINVRGNLCLTRTKVDMIPAGLKGIYFIFMDKKPRYISPDFKGTVMYDDANRIKDMDNLEVQAAKARYIVYRDMVERPRYIEEEDGSLSLCSLPGNMVVYNNPFLGYCLDLTRTSISEKQKLGGFKDVVLYPKKAVQEEFSFVLSNQIAHHRGHQMGHSRTKICE